MGKKLKSTLNNPSLLNSLTKNDEAIQVIIETPKEVVTNMPSTKSSESSR
jgi:hypothetical protein